jgi:hypothetical protein
MKKSQLELSNKNNKAILIKERAKHIEGVKLNKNKDLPPLPILEGKNKLSYKKENYIRVDKNLDEDGNDERWKFFEELLIR